MKKLMVVMLVIAVSAVSYGRMDFGKLQRGFKAQGSESSGSEGDVQSAADKSKADARVIRALESQKLKYEVKESGNVNVAWNVGEKGGEKRSQVTVISSGTEQYGGLEIREVWSVAYKGPRLPRNILAKYLIDNSQSKIGDWQLVKADDTHDETLIYCVKAPANVDAALLAKFSNLVARVADEAESELGGGDDF